MRFGCIGGGGVLPLCCCQTLGWVMHQKAGHLALGKVCICLHAMVCAWQYVEKCAGWIKDCAFGCIGGGSVMP